MNNRSRTEIASQILEAAINGSTKTKIMYKSFLSYEQLKDYLQTLIENRLIECNQAEQIYTTTNKGHKFMKIYRQMNDLVLPVEQRLANMQRV